MNSCILMGEVVQDPQLRYTSDNQTAISEMVVQIPGIREDDPPATLKVVGWGTLAQEIQEKYHVGDRLIVEGRLNMARIDRPEGFKETRAELTVQRIHLIGADASVTTASAPASTASASVLAATPKAKPPARTPSSTSATSEPARTPAYAAKATPEPAADYDDIPF